MKNDTIFIYKSQKERYLRSFFIAFIGLLFLKIGYFRIL